MNTREKLIELLDIGLDKIDRGSLPFAVAVLADHLIASGVTFAEDNNVPSKWISVKDRLPEKSDKYLCNVKSSLFRGATYQAILGYDKGGFHDGCMYMEDVTHWMPLPKPPKEETIYCKDCEHLMFSDCYGECSKGHKGIVKPNDTCKYATRKLPKGE